MQEQEHDSNFVSGLKIKTSAYITELIILNKIKWEISKGIKVSKPICPFWRKAHQTTPDLQKLAETFKLEITYVKNLLHVFSAKTLAEYIKRRGIITIRFLPLEKQKAFVFNLYSEEVEWQKEKITKRQNKIDEESLVVNVGERKTRIRKGII
jgi:hypothetical protein